MRSSKITLVLFFICLKLSRGDSGFYSLSAEDLDLKNVSLSTFKGSVSTGTSYFLNKFKITISILNSLFELFSIDCCLSLFFFILILIIGLGFLGGECGQ